MVVNGVNRLTDYRRKTKENLSSSEDGDSLIKRTGMFGVNSEMTLKRYQQDL